jgi:chemotaxis protein MotB
MAKTPPPKPNADEDEGSGVPEWVVTYGDMMSLLLTFFIMLVSMSEIKSDEGEVRAMMDSIRKSFGPTQGHNAVSGRSTQVNSSMNALSSKSNRSEGGTGKGGQDSNGRSGSHQSAAAISQGPTVTLGGPSQFARFDASLSDDLKRNLDIIADVIRDKSNRIMVRGHASPEPLPPDSPYLDQLNLSFARASAASEHLISKGIDRRRLLVSAAADNEPKTRTRFERKQKQNRRVDVFLIDSYTSHR